MSSFTPSPKESPYSFISELHLEVVFWNIEKNALSNLLRRFLALFTFISTLLLKFLFLLISINFNKNIQTFFYFYEKRSPFFEQRVLRFQINFFSSLCLQTTTFLRWLFISFFSTVAQSSFKKNALLFFSLIFIYKKFLKKLKIPRIFSIFPLFIIKRTTK